MEFKEWMEIRRGIIDIILENESDNIPPDEIADLLLEYINTQCRFEKKGL